MVAVSALSSKGLFGEVFFSDTELRSMDDALALMENEADGEFVSTRVEYGKGTGWGYNPLSQMLGHDTESLSADADASQNFDQAAIRLTGQIWLEEGVHTFYSRTDDGFRLQIDGQDTAAFEGRRGAAETEGVFETTTAGWHDIRVDYFDWKGGSTLEIEHSVDGGPRQVLDEGRLMHEDPNGAITNDSLPKGLYGEVFFSDTELMSMSDALALMEDEADGDFISTRVEYGKGTGWGYNPLSQMLGHDAESLSADADATQNFDQAAIRLTGQIWLEEGVHTFYNLTDDGFRLQIDGQDTAAYEGRRGAAETEGVIEVQTAGWHDIRVDYFDWRGGSTLEIEHSVNGGPREILDEGRLMHPENAPNTPITEAVVASDDSFVKTSGTTLVLDTKDLLENDAGADGGPLTVAAVQAFDGATVFMEGGKIYFTAAQGAEGTAGFEYTLTDGVSSDTAAVSVDITPAEEDQSYAQALVDQAAANAGVGLADPSLAVGLSGFSYWKSPAFLDLMKQATFPSIRDADGENVKVEALVEQGYVDANGYPVRMYEGNDALPGWQQGYDMIVSIHHQNDFIREETSGDFVVEWKGEGEISLVGFEVSSQEVISDANGNILGGRMTGTWGYEDDLKIVKILDTDPGGLGNNIRDISVVKAEYKDMHDVGAIFDPRYLELIEDHHTLRFLSWMQTNGSDVKTLEDVASVDSATWAGSVNATSSPEIAEEGALALGSQIPFEVMVQLANETGADPWFNIPLKADDDYVRALAAYVDEHLDDGLVAKFELSNEVWNWAYGFEQVREASLLGSDGEDAGNLRDAREYYGYRSAEIRNILNTEMGRVDAELVLGTQTVYFEVAKMVEAGVDRYFSEHDQDGQMSDVFDTLAVTGYFEGINNSRLDDLRQHWYDESEALFESGATETKHQFFVERAADYLKNGLDSLSEEELELVVREANGSFRNSITDPLQGYLRGNFAENKRMADDWGLELIQYESDSHIAPKNYNADAESEWFQALNLSEEMGEILKITAQIFREEGGTLVNDFAHLGETPFGLWDTRSHLEDENPISQSYDDYNTSAAEQFGSINEGRDETAFLQGVTTNGTAGANILVGTAQRDYLLGGDGADLLVGGASTDGLNGGAGVDIALFDGHSDEFTFRFDENSVLYVTGEDAEDRLANIEILAFAGSRDFLSVSSLSGTDGAISAEQLIADFNSENPIGEDLFNW
ncbi:PA14 domain-containing protein [Roseobacter sp. OBYS 0001]|uniref:PA14 domain-containing protein n=1 Tax=Roseobacter sp. OBYS 0001 TaxID=882651 RepID=UPI001BB97E9A|nr:PA14 domain-containing protein [Roseobacter sp. OBYS 0001]GIT89259.1 hypothetical protein ROBYS_42750 [Roseobacter sp. OBYS 0001]